jgi:hypothetical protein
MAAYMITQLPNGGDVVYDFAYPKDVVYSQSFSKTKNNPLYDPDQSLETAYQRILYNKRYKTIGKSSIKTIQQAEDLTNIFDKPTE